MGGVSLHPQHWGQGWGGVGVGVFISLLKGCHCGNTFILLTSTKSLEDTVVHKMCVFRAVKGHLGAVSENTLNMGREAQGLSVSWAIDKSGKLYSFAGPFYLIAFGSAVSQAQLFTACQVHARCPTLGKESTGD